MKTALKKALVGLAVAAATCAALFVPAMRGQGETTDVAIQGGLAQVEAPVNEAPWPTEIALSSTTESPKPDGAESAPTSTPLSAAVVTEALITEPTPTPTPTPTPEPTPT
ncbi:MAG: hypothetical protein ACKVK3_17420, partial [Acidimicrobiales bacterium]